MSQKKIIKIDDLKQADVLLFSASEDIVSQLIAKITDSPVTHSALSYYDYNMIAEETPPYAQLSEIKERMTNREITVMRLIPRKDDMSKVLDIAKTYVDSKVPYSKLNLVFVGIYMLFKKSLVNSKLQILLSHLIKYITYELIKIIDEAVYGSSQPMVCSQFVYNCFEHAGEDYKLIIKNEYAFKSLLKYIQEYIDKNKLSLEPKLVKDIHELFTNKANSNDGMLVSKDEEEFLKKIYIELEEGKLQTLPTSDEPINEDLVIATHELCSVLWHIYGNTNDTSLVIKNRDTLESKPINEMLDIEQYFVTPGDLLTNCINLTIMGTLDNNSAEICSNKLIHDDLCVNELCFND
jgi:hypothetical protein